MNKETIDVYRNLQEHLDKMPVGFPTAISGVDLKILKFLFTPEEARLALKLSYIPTPLKKIYRKVRKNGMTIEELEKKMDKMYKKGSIHRSIASPESKNGNEVKSYANAFYLIGMFEFQLNRMTREFVLDYQQYFSKAFFEKEYNKTNIPQLRIIPIGQSISYDQRIASYDDVKKIIENINDTIAVAECICRKGKEMIGTPCKKTDLKETCFTFGVAAQTYIERGLGRQISKEEALKLFAEIEKEGLVLQPTNAQFPFNICCCCGCCCEVLVNQKKFENPSKLFASNYHAEVNPNLCEGCGTCEDKCQMEAISMQNHISTVNLNYCIGCGACVPFCPQNAITLKRKELEIVPPKRPMETYVAIMNKKAELARMEKS